MKFIFASVKWWFVYVNGANIDLEKTHHTKKSSTSKSFLL